MIHQFIFACPKPGLSEPDFQNYWLNVHAQKYARHIPQIRRYGIDLRVEVPGMPCQLPGSFSAAEIWLGNEQEQLASLQSPEFLEGARRDEPSWAAFWSTFGLDTTAHMLLDDPAFSSGDKRCKLLMLLKRKAGMGLQEFRQHALTSHGDRVKELPGLRHYVQGHVRDSFYVLGESRFDAVDQLWFADEAALAAALSSNAYRDGVAWGLQELVEPRYLFTLACRSHWVIGPAFREVAPVSSQVGKSCEARVGTTATTCTEAESEQTRRLVEQWYQSIGRGDTQAIMNGLAENVLFELPRDEHNQVIPYLGRHRGRAAVAAAFGVRAETTEVLQYECRLVRAQGKDAFAIVYTKARCRATAAEFEIEDTHHLQLDTNRQIAFWKVYFDPNTEVAAFKSKIDERLLHAVSDADEATASRLLDEGANPNAQDADSGLTVLMIAAGRGDKPITALLLRHGANVHIMEPKAGTTALHKACQGGNVAVVSLLIKAGAFVDVSASSTGHTPLWDALWYKWPEVVKYLLDRGAGLGTKAYYGFSLEEHIKFEEGVNPTESAREAFRRARDMVEARRRADREAVDQQYLMAAVVRGDLARVKELLLSGARVDELAPRLNGFNDLHTPLLVACRDGRTEIAAELARMGADVNAVEPTFGAVPLHKAVYNGHVGITQMLVQQPGIKLDFQGATNGYTPLHDALWHGYRDCARILLDAGARTDVCGHDGKTPLDIAIATFGYDDELVKAIREKSRIKTSLRLAVDHASVVDRKLRFFIQMRWNIEGRLSFDQLWDLELKEAEWAMSSGPEALLWKVAGQKRVVGIVAVESIDELDRVILGRLPMREYLEFEQIWPLRDYEVFIEDARKHYRV